ncbi:MAG TPA: aldehyde dehydrogenase family protein [Burkholderiales bacterium]|nr:aldehyde dehydrogenase family protein [Burkholderiales bacterium]
MDTAAGLLAQLGITERNFGACIAPEWLPADEHFPSINPTTGEVIGWAGRCSRSQYALVLRGAEEAFHAWRRVPAPHRGEVVRLIVEALRRHKSVLGRLICLETGKIKQEADGEVQEMIDIGDFAVGQSRMLYGRTMHSERPCHRMYEQWHPLGIVGVITAFNFPAAVWAWNAFIAAVCGDVVVWKPSPKAPLIAIAIQHIVNDILRQTGHDGVFSLFTSDGPELAQWLVEDTRVPLVSFTGSSGVGRQVAQVVAARMGRCLLECSGNNAVIVDDTANLDLAVPAIVFGAVGTAGQRCTTTRRLIVHESRVEEIEARLISAYRQVRIGDPLEPSTLMGPLIDAQACARFRETMAELDRLGGQVLAGGRTLDRPGFFVEPTMARAENHWAVVQRETFAPVLYVMPFGTVEQAVALNNAVPQGLSSALFTDSLQRAEQFLSVTGSDCGIANINIGTSGAEVGGAFGGEKETGGGREAGSDAWKGYMRRQTSTINWSRELPLAQGIQFRIA